MFGVVVAVVVSGRRVEEGAWHRHGGTEDHRGQEQAETQTIWWSTPIAKQVVWIFILRQDVCESEGAKVGIIPYVDHCNYF